MVRCLFLIACLLLVNALGKTVSKSPIDYAAFHYTEKTDVIPHPTETVMDRGLVSQTVDQATILDEYSRYSSQTTIKNTKEMPILGFITPWNKHGYEVAKIFKNKFTHLSPCWFQVSRNNAEQLIIKGEQDIDKEWMAAIRSDCDGACPHITPRLTWEAHAIRDEDIPVLVQLISDLITTNDFDGFVFEFSYLKDAIPILRLIREAIGSKDFITTVQPEHLRYNKKDDHVTEQISEIVDFTILMTYDYSSKQHKLGSNAPMSKSIKSLVENSNSEEKKEILKKVMIGLPMYGYRDYDAIIGDQLISTLKRFTVAIEYHEKSQDHFIQYKDEKGKNHFISYPTLYFLQARIDLAKKLNTGLSLWEIGQGLDYFYDLF